MAMALGEWDVFDGIGLGDIDPIPVTRGLSHRLTE
jgi:hypothetical protein